MPQSPFYTRLNNRALLIITGKDAQSFLQGLISNDITVLDTQPMLYSCLLSPQGKFLYDFFIRKDTEQDRYILDCEGGERLESLTKMLKMYKLRADIQFEQIDDATVYAIIGHDKQGTPDPRHPEMGTRLYDETPQDIPESAFEAWDTHRINLCVPNGSRDLIPQKSTLLESNIDKLNGVSFTKGCFVGQELTARMHYRGLAKKHLRTVTCDALQLSAFPACGTPLKLQDKTIGEMRASCGDKGIALIKDSVTL